VHISAFPIFPWAPRLKIVVHREPGGDFLTAGFSHQVERRTDGDGPFFVNKIFHPRQNSQQGAGGLETLGVSIFDRVYMLYIDLFADKKATKLGVFMRLSLRGYQIQLPYYCL
jgi:hypothetical protein